MFDQDAYYDGLDIDGGVEPTWGQAGFTVIDTNDRDPRCTCEDVMCLCDLGDEDE